MMKSSVTAVLVAILAVGCIPGGDDDMAPEDLPLAASGRYDVVSTFDVTAEALLPPPAYDAIDLLSGLRDDPAGTLIGLLDDAGVPVIDKLYAALPAVLESKLEGWINAYVDAAVFGDDAVTARIDELLGLVETTLTRFDLVGELTLDGAAGASHRVRAIAFRLRDQDVRIDVPAAPAPIVLDATCSASVTQLAGSDDAALELGEHAFGLAYGEYAYQAIERVVFDRYGTDVRGALGLLLDCPALAASVADRCVLGVCVGHEAQLVSVCESGLDLVAAELHDRLAAVRFDTVRLDRGAATLVDGAPADHVADAIVGGVWQAQIDAGQGLRPAPATFVGSAKR